MIEVGTAEQDAPITFIPDFLDPETADQAFTTLLAEIPWERLRELLKCTARPRSRQ